MAVQYRSCCVDAARARALSARAAAALSVPGRGHRSRPLVRARPERDEPPRPGRLPHRRAALRPARGARVRGLRTDARRSDRPLRHAAGEDRRDAERGRSRVHAGRRARRLPPVRRRDPGAQEPARRRRRGARGRAAARRRRPGEGAGARARARAPRRRAARLRGQGAARGSLPRRRLPPASVAVRGLRAAGARGDGVRHAGRRDRRRGHAGGRRRRRRVLRPSTASRRPYAGRFAESERGRGPVSNARGYFSWDETARRTVAAYREVLGL